jgi:UDPglucose 6-dehydrogenase
LLKIIAYIGYGFVGRACHKAFKDNSDAIIIDPKYPAHSYSDIYDLKPAITFVAVPAPIRDDGSVDASAIYAVFKQLQEIKYKGIIVVKSTIPPAIARDLFVQFMDLEYVYSPEFLRESHWEEDALHPKIIVLGGGSQNCLKVQEYYKKHSGVWDIVQYAFTSYEEAALVKYTLNSYLATKVVFMNQLKALYYDQVPDSKTEEDWERFTKILTSDFRFGASHVSVPGPDGKFGYGGTCFPKDVKAMLGFDKNGHLTVLKEASIVNTKLRLANDEKDKS